MSNEKSFPSEVYQTTSAKADVLVFWRPFSGVYQGWIRYGQAYLSASYCKKTYSRDFYVKRFHENGSRRFVPHVIYGTWLWHDEEMEMKRLQKQEDAGGARGELPSDEWFITNCPLTMDYLTNTRYDDGSQRTPSTLSLFIDEGKFKVACNDKDAEASLYAAGDTFQDCLVALERRLNANNDWRFWKGKKKR
jgi:hypothetical protein